MYDDKRPFFGEDFSTLNISKWEEHTFDCWFDGLVEINKGDHDKYGHSKVDIALRALEKLEYYFAIKRKEKKYLIHSDSNSFWISNVLKEQLTQKKTTMERKRAIGAVVECLYQMCGAKENQLKGATQEAVVKWLATNPNTVKTSHALFTKTWPEGCPCHPAQILVSYGPEIIELFEERDVKCFVVEVSRNSKRELSREKIKLAFREFHEEVLWLKSIQTK